jgi:hypothetical protein
VRIVAERKSRFGAIRRKLFEAMHRNALPATEFLPILPNRAIDLGGQVRNLNSKFEVEVRRWEFERAEDR